MSQEKTMFQVIYFENDEPSNIIETEYFHEEPTEEFVMGRMKEFESGYSQVYYDKYDSDEYDELVVEYTL